MDSMNAHKCKKWFILDFYTGRRNEMRVEMGSKDKTGWILLHTHTHTLPQHKSWGKADGVEKEAKSDVMLKARVFIFRWEKLF